MYRVVARQYIKPEKMDEFLSLARELAELTNKNEPGCVSYKLYRDAKDPYAVAMFEEYRDEAAQQAHMKSEHFARLGGPMVACWDKPIDDTYYISVDS